jgi:molecular chaperone GrpE
MRKSEKDRDQSVADQVDENETSVGDDATEETEENELGKVTAERDEYLEQLLRSRAEFINFRKRSEQERLKLGEMFTANTLSQFLPVLDDFDRAIGAVPDKDKDSGWLAGIAMIQKKLQGILERAGVQAIDALNSPFDPAVHEAVATEPGSSGATVVEVYQKGYKLGDTLLRAAMVKTGNASGDTDEAKEQFDA